MSNLSLGLILMSWSLQSFGQHPKTSTCPRVAGVLKGNITRSQWDAEMGDTGTWLQYQKPGMLPAGCLKGNLSIHVGFGAPEEECLEQLQLKSCSAA